MVYDASNIPSIIEITNNGESPISIKLLPEVIEIEAGSTVKYKAEDSERLLQIIKLAEIIGDIVIGDVTPEPSPEPSPEPDPGPKPEPATIQEIKITKYPNKMEYIEGETLDLSGLEVSALYSDGTQSVINNEELTIDPPDGTTNLAFSNSTIYISYSEFECTLDITINPEEVV